MDCSGSQGSQGGGQVLTGSVSLVSGLFGFPSSELQHNGTPAVMRWQHIMFF